MRDYMRPSYGNRHEPFSADCYADSFNATFLPGIAAAPDRTSGNATTPYDLSVKLPATSTLLEYLIAPNPSPALVQRIAAERSQHSHFWFDIRNLRSWTDFNVNTISMIPGLLQLLQIPIPTHALAAPGHVSQTPETHAQLHDICRDHHAVKVNAALRVAQGTTHMALRSLEATPGSLQQPEFVSNYKSDHEKTIYGDGRGRVVGVVKCFDQWNSGMRAESPAQRVKYLHGLAHLHRFMREHGCRYGFIMTEIELVCVRCGGPPPSTGNDVPLFGFLELAAPIQMATHGLRSGFPVPPTDYHRPSTGPCRVDGSDIQMTATLALFYLHMLAKESPLPGQYGWRLDVGGPAALTRQYHLDRDDWIPKPNLSEKREAKRSRGWVWPDEKLNRRECGRGKRTARAAS
ncbi:hypothetical protein LTR50_007823 [Elasticomyces elasticus]|nr:hypothetical protein LTR50_007823 [Elasticomyces elasticus]